MDKFRLARAFRLYRGNASIDNPYDFDRSGAIGISDDRAQRLNLYRSLPAFTGPPAARPGQAAGEDDRPSSLLA